MTHKSLLAIVFSLLIILISVGAFAQGANALEGKWRDEKHPEKQVQMYRQNGFYFGKTVETGKADESKTVFKELAWNEKTKQFDGKIINPQDRTEHAISIAMQGNDKFSFSVSVLLFTKRFSFTRVKD